MRGFNYGFFDEFLKLAGQRHALSPSGVDIGLSYTKPLLRQIGLKKRFDEARSSAQSKPTPLVNLVTALGEIKHLDTLPRHVRGALITAALEKNKRLLGSAQDRSGVSLGSPADKQLMIRDRVFTNPFTYLPTFQYDKFTSYPILRTGSYSAAREADRYAPNKIIDRDPDHWDA